MSVTSIVQKGIRLDSNNSERAIQRGPSHGDKTLDTVLHVFERRSGKLLRSVVAISAGTGFG